jgi:hypothetical protein
MPYHLLSSEEWDQFLNEELSEAYLQSLADKNKSYRIQQVQLIKSFGVIQEAKQRNALLTGICIHIVEQISQEKKYQYLFSAEKSDQFLKYMLGLGSTLFTKIISKVYKSSDSNLLDDKVKLIYLQKLSDFIKLYSANIPKKFIESIPNLLCDINQSIARIIGRSALDVHLLVSSAQVLINKKNRPSPDDFLAAFKQIPSHYEFKNKNNSSYFSYFKKQNPERHNQIKFIEMLSKHCKRDDHALMYAYLLYCMHVINSNNSNLYVECKRVANIENEDVINVYERHAYYSRLTTYISDKIVEGNWKQLESSGFQNPHGFFTKMCNDLDIIKSQISGSENKIVDYPYLKAATAGIAGYGIRVLCGPAVIAFGEMIVANGGILSILKPEVVIIGTLIASFVKDQMISSVAKQIAGNVNALLIEGTKQTVIITYNSLKQLAEMGELLVLGKKDLEMKSNERFEMIPENDKQWIDALLQVDDSIFSKSKKDIISKAITIQEENQRTVEPSKLLMASKR